MTQMTVQCHMNVVLSNLTGRGSGPWLDCPTRQPWECLLFTRTSYTDNFGVYQFRCSLVDHWINRNLLTSLERLNIDVCWFCVFASAWMIVGKVWRAWGDLFFLQKTTLTFPNLITLHVPLRYSKKDYETIGLYFHKSGVKIMVKFHTFNFFRIVSWSLMSR